MTEHQPSKRNKKATIISWSITSLLAVIIVVVVAYAYNRDAAEPEAPNKKLANVEVATIVAGEHRETLTLPARLTADRVATISSEFGGILAKWLVDEGSEVQVGQLVAELDTESIDTNLDELKAALETARKNVKLAQISKESAEVGLENTRKQANLQDLGLAAAKSEQELARAEFRRINHLVQKKVVDMARLDTVRNALNQADLAVARSEEAIASARLSVRDAEVQIKQAQTNYDLAKARIKELDAAMASLKVNQNKAFLKAPISGRIEEHLVEPGEVVGTGDPLARLYDLSYMRATVNVPDRYVAFLDPDNPATRAYVEMNTPGARQEIRTQLILPGLPKLTGGSGSDVTLDTTIARIAQSSDPESNTFKVELRLKNPGEALRHGMIARGRIEYLYYPKAINIPVKSVQVTDEGPRVLTVEAMDGREIIRIREIEPISVEGPRLLVGKGLTAGERLVVAGWKGLVTGEEVNVIVEDGKFKGAEPGTEGK